jgi:hypothetical protein
LRVPEGAGGRSLRGAAAEPWRPPGRAAAVRGRVG